MAKNSWLISRRLYIYAGMLGCAMLGGAMGVVAMLPADDWFVWRGAVMAALMVTINVLCLAVPVLAMSVQTSDKRCFPDGPPSLRSVMDMNNDLDAAKLESAGGGRTSPRLVGVISLCYDDMLMVGPDEESRCSRLESEIQTSCAHLPVFFKVLYEHGEDNKVVFMELTAKDMVPGEFHKHMNFVAETIHDSYPDANIMCSSHYCGEEECKVSTTDMAREMYAYLKDEGYLDND